MEEAGAEGDGGPEDESDDDGKAASDEGLDSVTQQQQPLQVPRMKRSRNMMRAASAFNISTAADLADDTSGADPQVIQWQMSDSGSALFLKVCVKGLLFCGELPLESAPHPQPVRKPRGQRKRSIDLHADNAVGATRTAGSPLEGPGADDATDDIQEEQEEADTLRGKRPRTSLTNAGTESAEGRDAAQSQPLSRRHAKAEERYRKLAQDGAPPETLCSLCLLEEGETVEYDVSDTGEQATRPLGKLLLVRTSTITHAWAHETCARWCPEVREIVDPKGKAGEPSTMEGLAEAVRRGRRIKCTECGQRGATLGCHAKNCRKSYHLPCACVAGCLLEVRATATMPLLKSAAMQA